MSARRLRILCCALGALFTVLVAALGSSAPLSAQADGSTEATSSVDEAIDSVVAELAYLQLSGAFAGNVPLELAELPERLGLQALSMTEVAAGFAEVNSMQGPAALELLAELQVEISPPVRDVLSPTAVVSPLGIPYAPYVRAYGDLARARVALVGQPLSSFDDSLQLLPVLDGLPRSRPPLPPPQGIDRGGPPDVLIQGDGQVVDQIPTAVAAEPFPLSLDPVEILIVAAVAVIVLGLITMLVTSGHRRAERAASSGGLSGVDLMEATRAIHAVETIAQLCQTAADKARLLTGAEAVMVTIHGFEAASGVAFDVPTELVFRANRSAQLVSDGSLHAIPINPGDDIIGLLVAKGGHAATLESFQPLVGDGYASVAAREETAALVFVDGLTGIANRRRFDNDLHTIVGQASETHSNVAIAMFDVDHFKAFNDSNGHQAGDDVLRAVAELISTNLRTTDIVYRYGGEEFVALLPGATVDDAYDVVERIREIVETTAFDGESSQPQGAVTLSIGVAAAPCGDGLTLVHTADMALYKAKTTGRNRVVLETPAG